MNAKITPMPRQPSPQVPMPPHSDDAESGVIGSILQDASLRPSNVAATIIEAQEQLSPDYFYNPVHRTIWEVIVQMFEKRQPLDLIAVTQELRDRNLLDSVGGASYVTSLFSFVPTGGNLAYYGDIMRDKFVLREIIAAGTAAVRRAYEEQDNVPGLLDETQEKFTAISLHRLTESPLKHIAEDLEQVVANFKNAKKHRGRTQGLATGFFDLDRMTNGVNPSEMIVLAARPSMGKTAFAMNIAQYVATPRETASSNSEKPWRYPGHPVGVFSLETSRLRLVNRILCGTARISLQRLRDGHLEKEDIENVENTAMKLYPRPIYIDETPALRIFDFRARARFAVVKLGVKLIVIDYVQLMTSGGKAASNPYERSIELTRISQVIKQTARELNVPIIAIAQLNREAEKNQRGKPRMSNLRECGAFEQDADQVWLLWRGEYYAEDEDEKRDLEGEAELNVAKQKDGPTGDVKLTFLKEYTRFESHTKTLYTPDQSQWQEGYAGDESKSPGKAAILETVKQVFPDAKQV